MNNQKKQLEIQSRKQPQFQARLFTQTQEQPFNMYEDINSFKGFSQIDLKSTIKSNVSP